MYLIIGGNGFLGNYIIKSILEKTDDRIIATARDVSGLNDSSRLHWQNCSIEKDSMFDSLVEDVRNQADLKVIFLAAYHHPDLVAEHPQTAWNINVTTLSKCINKLYFADKLFYASTDSVYGNSTDGYHFSETDALNPVNIYGRNKCAAEAVVSNYGFNVVRYPFLIAPSLVPGKMHFYDKIVNDLREGRAVEMFSDSYRSSLNFRTAADLMIDLCEINDRKIPSILNVCGDQDLSKYDIGLMIAEKIGVSSKLVKALKLEEGSSIFKTQRAATTLMDNSLVKQILHLKRIDFVI